MEEAYPAEEEVPEVHRQTVDQGELYNGMAVQLEDHHSAFYKQIIEDQEKQFDAAEAKKEAEQREADREAYRRARTPTYVPDHVLATNLVPEHRNFDVDRSIYNGLNLLNNNYIQLGDHSNDQDDIVPEFSEEVKPEQEQEMVQEKHFDFAGQEIQETYDE